MQCRSEMAGILSVRAEAGRGKGGGRMTYEQALEYTHSLLRFGIQPGLERIEELLKRLGNPNAVCG